MKDGIILTVIIKNVCYLLSIYTTSNVFPSFGGQPIYMGESGTIEKKKKKKKKKNNT